MSAKARNWWAALIVLLTLSLMGGGYFYWRQSPVYSLAVVKRAIQNRDLATFEERVDLDACVDSAYDDLSDLLIEEGIGKSGLFSLVPGAQDLARGISLAARGRLCSLLKDEVRQALSSPQEASFWERTGLFQADFTFWDSLGLGATVVEYTVVEGSRASVGVRLYPRGLENPCVVRLAMYRTPQTGNVWRIQRIDNLPEVCATLGIMAQDWLQDLPSL